MRRRALWHTMRMPGLALAALLSCALLLRLLAAWSDVESLLLRVTSDDAYYYLQIARSVASGAGASLDGETPTNGFHPLWLLVVSAVHCGVGDPQLALRLTLSISAVLGTASVALVHAVVLRLTGRQVAALLAAAFYGLHPYVIVESVNGLETALAVFTTALTTWIFIGVAHVENPGWRRAGLGLGAAGGAMMLARTDAVFVWACMLLFLARRPRGRRALALPFVAGAVSTLLVAPWLLWSLARFGTIVQVSALALPELLRADYLAQHQGSFGAALDRGVFLVRKALLVSLAHLYFVPRGLPLWPGGVVAIAWLGSMLFVPCEPERRDARHRLALLAAPAAGILLALVYHAGVRWWTREWYFAPAGWLGAVVIGLGLAYLRELARRLPQARQRTAAVALASGAALLIAALLGPHQADRWGTRSPHRVQQLHAARWLEANTAPAARVGAFNAGILSYFSGRTVVNLDGAVNRDAFEARREGRLMHYVLARKIDYLVDWRGTLPMAGCHLSPSARCERVAVVGDPLPNFAGSPILVLRVMPVGAAPR